MNRALIVGVDNYPDSPLDGCVNDAEQMTEVLSKNADGSPNFHCKKPYIGTVMIRPVTPAAAGVRFTIKQKTKAARMPGEM